MWGYAFRLAAFAALFVLAGALAIWLFSNVWMRVSLGAACLVVGGGLLLIAWRIDRKGREARKGIDELPPV